MNLPKLQGNSFKGKRVILRADLDVDIDSERELYRLEALVPTIKYLSEGGAKTIIIGHRGRPEGMEVKELSLEKISGKLQEIVGIDISFSSKTTGEEPKQKISMLKDGGIIVLENLRFDKGEEENSQSYAKSLADLGEVYVNEAFASSHRDHASIVGVPMILTHYAGIRFTEETEILGNFFMEADKPVIVIIGGAKEDKLKYIDPIKKFADKILIGGRLPDYLVDLGSVRNIPPSEKIVTGNLIMDKEDISIHTMERFEEEIKKAKTILLAGPMGKYEEEGHRQGTERIFMAVSETHAYKIAGGGDTIAAIELFGIKNNFNFISVGGGAMLEYLAKGTLPGIEALIH